MIYVLNANDSFNSEIDLIFCLSLEQLEPQIFDD